MLRKLLKYDLSAVARLFWIGAVLSVAGGILGGVLIRAFSWIADLDTDNLILNLSALFFIMTGLVCLFAVAVSFLMTKILVYVRFYKHFFTDEGYLTFTLPVKRSTLLLSKTLNAVIWFSAQFVLTALSVLLFILFVTPAEPGGGPLNPMVLEGIAELLAIAWTEIGAWLLVYLLEALLIGLAYLVFSTLLVYFCITVGAVLVKRAKILLSIGIYYAVSSALSILRQLLLLVLGPFLLDGLSLLALHTTKNQFSAIFALLILLIPTVLAALGALLYLFTQRLLDRKLNLA